ncbi:hypothetical protein [Pseudomonas sp. PS01301]|uniref:hypothetical protein n=1 Tax=Pseudomonas sp. PS01301 TaxID=2991437 RepID=UPI00249A04D0|nr:hypothetical protein [Pseudomonas sp. PS01301]
MANALRMSPEAYVEHQRRVLGAAAPASKSAQPVKGAAKPVAGATQRLYALGRMADGHMNKTEARYAEHLDALKRTGEVLWWAFEGIKFKLADRTHLCVDFAVMKADGMMQFHDVKGSKGVIQDKAAVKMKVAAAQFPFPFFYAFPPPRVGGDWILESV